MSVELEPPELGFKRPFTHEVSQVLRLHNPNSDPVAFKVKTTAPKQYCVRPNSGRIEPSGSVEVQVLLQAMKEDPPPDARCRDKFLVQSVAINAAADRDGGTVTQIWNNIEQTAKSSIQERKIRVSFLPAEGSGAANGLATGAGAGVLGGIAAATGLGGHHPQQEEEPPNYASSPTPSAVTPQKQQQSPGGMYGSYRPDEQSAVDSPRDTAASTANTASTTLSNAATAVSNSIPTSQQDVSKQLEEAKATIARLQAQAADGLRQRKPQEAAQNAVNAVSQSLKDAPAPGGVPIQIVAGLCLLCFLVAWLFF